MKDYSKIFNANPGADIIYVVAGMPFLRRQHADNHSRTTGKPVETIHRYSLESDTDAPAETPPARKGKKK